MQKPAGELVYSKEIASEFTQKYFHFEKSRKNVSVHVYCKYKIYINSTAPVYGILPPIPRTSINKYGIL